jgi:hypothetical protein
MIFNQIPRLLDGLEPSGNYDLVTKGYFDDHLPQIPDLTDCVKKEEIYKAGVRGKDIEIQKFGSSTTCSEGNKSVNICGYVSGSSTKNHVSIIGEVSGESGVAIGHKSKAGLGSVAVGYNTQTVNPYSTALGFSAVASGSYSVAIGYNVSNSVAYSVMIGNTSATSLKLGPTNYLLSSAGMTFNEQPKIKNTLPEPTADNAIITKKFVDDRITTTADSVTVGNNNQQVIDIGFLRIAIEDGNLVFTIKSGVQTGWKYRLLSSGLPTEIGDIAEGDEPPVESSSSSSSSEENEDENDPPVDPIEDDGLHDK